MINFKAAEQIKARIEQLDELFERVMDTASEETQQKIIDRISELKDDLSTAKSRTVRNWSDELASLNID